MVKVLTRQLLHHCWKIVVFEGVIVAVETFIASHFCHSADIALLLRQVLLVGWLDAFKGFSTIEMGSWGCQMPGALVGKTLSLSLS